jgi:hypothetical protein
MMLLNLSKGLGTYEEEDDTESVDSTEEIDVNPEAPCSVAQFQVNMFMPPQTTDIKEADIEVVEIE